MKISSSLHMGQYRNNKYLKAFGDNVRKIRKSKGMSQESLAYGSELNLSQVARIERGVVNPTICTVYLLAKALGVPPKDLFDFDYND